MRKLAGIMRGLVVSVCLCLVSISSIAGTPTWVGPYQYSLGSDPQNYAGEDAAIQGYTQIWIASNPSLCFVDIQPSGNWTVYSTIEGVENKSTKSYAVRYTQRASTIPCQTSVITSSVSGVRFRTICTSTQRRFDDKCVDVSPVIVHNGTGANLGKSDTSVGDPVNPGTGNQWHVASDYVDRPGSLGLSLSRTYNSAARIWRPELGNKFGPDWTTDYDIRLTKLSGSTSTYDDRNCYTRLDTGAIFCEGIPPLQSASTTIPAAVRVLRGDGKSYVFNKSGTGATWVGGGDTNDRVSAEFGSDGTTVVAWNYTSADDDSVDRFNADGLLLSITARNGNALRMTYSTGQTNDTNSDRYPLDAPVCGRVPSGATWPANRLMCVTDSWGRQLQFAYDTSGRVNEVVDPAGQSILYQYDGPTGGCVAGNETTGACNANNLTGVQFPGGASRQYVYNEAARINGGAACAGQTAVGNGFGSLKSALTGVMDENGSRYLSWSYDCNGRAVLSEIGTGARKTALSYGSVGTTGSLNTTVTHYTGAPNNAQASSNIFGMAEVKGVSKLNSLNSPCLECGDIQSVNRDSNGNVTISYDFAGFEIALASFDLSRNLEVSRTEARNTSLQRKISTTWHPTFRIRTGVAEPKRITTFAYDDHGNVLTRTVQATSDTTGAAGFGAAAVGTARVWRYEYNQYGQLTKETGPRTDVADVTTYDYDAKGNLATVTNALGQVTTLSGYDDNGLVGSILEPNGTLTQFTYTARGKLATRTVSNGVIHQTTSFEYDPVGQLTKVINPDGSWFTYGYDDAHRLTSIGDSLGNSIVYTLDLSGNRIAEQVKDPNGVLTRQISRVFNTLNQLTSVTGADQ